MTAPTAVRTAVPDLPAQRTAEHDAVPPAAPLPPGWGSAEDRTTAAWLLVFAVFLGAFISASIWLGSSVW